jgi:hypothetical protein
LKQLFIFLIITFSYNVLAQNSKELLVKAYTSKDSSNYYFKKAKKAIKSDADEAEYYFCKNAFHTDFGVSDSAIFYGETALKKLNDSKNYNSIITLHNNLSRAYNDKGQYENAIRNRIIGDKNDKVFGRLSKIGDFTKDTISELRDTIWAMNKEAISFEDLLGRISNFVNQAKIASEKINIELINSLNENFKKEFTSKEGIYTYRIIQEAINNAVKYAEPENVKVFLMSNQTDFQVVIEDDGNGFNTEEVVFGNGLLNMQKRAEEINGRCEIDSILHKGTKIIFQLP